MTQRHLSEEHRAKIAAAIRGRVVSPETGAKIAAAKRGKPRSAATKAKISASLTGRTQSPAVRATRVAIATRASASPTWIGTAVSYNGAHNRARQTLPLECAAADPSCRGRLEVALRIDAPEELLRVSRRGHLYFAGDDPAIGYQRLCASHHRRQDGNIPTLS